MMLQGLPHLNPNRHGEVLVLENEAYHPPLAVVPVQQSPATLVQTQNHPDQHHETLVSEYLTCHPLVTVVLVYQ